MDRIPHLTTWTCERCGSVVCEVSTDEPDVRPVHCPCGHIPTWRRGDE